jgi:purine nucleoside phosphorylase
MPKTLVNGPSVTNAAGGLNASYKVGDVVVLHDVRPQTSRLGNTLTTKAHQFSRTLRSKSIAWTKSRQLWSSIHTSFRCI